MSEETGYKKPPKDTQFGGKRANRRNTKGRPKTFDALRSLAQQIAHKELLQKDGSFATVAELILTGWATSKEPSLQIKFVEYAWGKVSTPVEVNANVKNDVKYTSDEMARAREEARKREEELLGTDE